MKQQNQIKTYPSQDRVVAKLYPKPVVLGFTGFSQSGKDSAAGFLVEEGWTRLAFADILRQSLYNLNPLVPVGVSQYDLDGGGYNERVQFLVDKIGWDRAKVLYPEIRQLLQRFGTDVGRELYGEDFWLYRVKNQIKNGGKYVITDVRFSNEVELVHSFGGNVYRINRPGTGAVNSHVSDTGIEALQIDGVIPNAGTLEHFRDIVLLVAGVNIT